MFSGPSYYQNVAAVQAQADANDARAKAREAGQETERLRHDVDRLLLITEALWTLLKKQNGYKDENLSALVQEIDLRDGQLDGRAGKVAALPCPQCGRINSNRYPRCIYCGTALPVQLFAS